ncbi:cysteine-rich RLK (RECEPTOR-like protein kinase) 15 [Forsythia ovata]|uniref:Cysteine-rich RLK (RECEPTOR-like protein kinase) 15 n=1 Tax=Forsythia ovata TaxID=205694 RepID=A0ABD1R6E6_9LAMI
MVLTQFILDFTGAKDNNTTRTVVIVIVAIVGCLILSLCIGIFLKKRQKHKMKKKLDIDDEMSSAEFQKYDFGTIRAATNFFSDDNKLGEGGFGTVYQGKLSNGNQIAVKRLSMNSGQGDLEFKNEVSLVAKLQHRNLVRILGFSLEGSERNSYPIMSPHLDWDKRYKIIGGVARGLLYLHEDSQLRIIHRDLKASNILLDGEMNPKISDFGMARLFVQDQTQGNTGRIVGTYGYMSPEYAMHGHISVKLDVFSFGILVLEIISGQRTNNFRIGDNVEDLLSFVSTNVKHKIPVFCHIEATNDDAEYCIQAWKYWREGSAENIVDPTLRESPGSLRDIVRCIHIGLLCVQENAADRPTMASVVLMLTNFSVTVQVPSKPAFFVSNSFNQQYNSRQLNTRIISKR